VPDFPTFFFSHARQDSEMPGKYLIRFFEDLEKKLAQWAGVHLGKEKLGKIDRRIQHGRDWDKDLSDALSKNRVLVVAITPLYSRRENCGKELGIFLARSPNLGIDANGALTGVSNVMLIRWLPEAAYTVNGVKNSEIPSILRLIEDTPADDGGDPELTAAIHRYVKKGMERCVESQPHYDELLDQFAKTIRDMPALAATDRVSFATAPNAFTHDWLARLAPAAGAAYVAPAAPLVPQALSSVVAFHVTRRSFTRGSKPVPFADSLIAEPLPTAPAPIDAPLGALLADMRAAGVAEGLTVFHAAADPATPVNAASILARLADLSAACVLTILVVDPDIWPGSLDNADAVEEIMRSPRWTGPVLIPRMEGRARNVDRVVAERGLSTRLVVLPPESNARVVALRHAFVSMRGRILRGSAEIAPGAERVPLLTGIEEESG
jgi:hypothetical protein